MRSCFAWMPIGLSLMICCDAVFADNNIASSAEISSRPYIGATLSYLVDGKVDASLADNTLSMSVPLAPRLDGGVPLWITFSFSQNVPVSGIRIYQGRYRNGRTPARHYVFEADTNRDGSYDVVLVNETNGEGGRWYDYRFHKVHKVSRIRFRALGWINVKDGPNYGVPAIEEIEILSPLNQMQKNKVNVEAHGQEVQFRAIDRLNERVKELKESVWREQFPRGLFTTMWRFWTPANKYDSRHVNALLSSIRRLGANRIWLYPETTGNIGRVNDIVFPEEDFALYYTKRRMVNDRLWAKRGLFRLYPFPSQVVLGYRENILAKLVEDIHRYNIGLIINQRLLPYGLKGWDFPRVSRPGEYPCPLSSKVIYRAAHQLVQELMLAGADGVAIGGDEFFFHGHSGRNENRSPYCRSVQVGQSGACIPTCETMFRKEYGMDVPPDPRKAGKAAFAWQLFQYERLAGLFGALAGEVRKHGGIVTTLFRPGEVKRSAYGVAYDIMGLQAGIDEMGSDPLWSNDNFNGHYYIANETKKLMAASPVRTAVVTLQTTPYFDNRDYRRPIMVYGSAISAIMHGAKGINYYKEEYLTGNNAADAAQWVAKVFSLIKYLDAKGLNEYETPKNIVLLYSRSSEDWWRMHHPRDAIKGGYPVLIQNAVMEVLFRSGISFDMYYLDQPETWRGLEKSQLILVPFGYSVSDAAWRRLLDLHGSGIGVWWMFQDPVLDEQGNLKRRSIPFPSDVFRFDQVGNDIPPYPILKKRILQQLNNWPGLKIPVTCQSEEDVECGMLVDGRRRLLFLQNWGERPAAVQLSVSLDAGRYHCEMIDLDNIYRLEFPGGGSCDSDSLKSAIFHLAPSGVNIIQIEPLTNIDSATADSG